MTESDFLVSARRIATRIWENAGRPFPFPVDEYASRHAIVEIDAIPGTCSALVMWRNQDKPTIIVNKSDLLTRRRFSLAHEIGHLVIPWHLGNVACHPDLAPPDTEEGRQEAEANEFAAELLMPTEALVDYTKGMEILDDILNCATAAVVSPVSAMIRILPRVRRPAAAIITDLDGVVKYVGRTATFAGSIPARGTLFNGESIGKLTISSRLLGRYRMFVAILPQDFMPLQMPEGGASANDLLRVLLFEHYHTRQERDTASRRINGVIGACFGRHKGQLTIELLTEMILQRLAAHRDLNKLAGSPSLAQFALKKAMELTAPPA